MRRENKGRTTNITITPEMMAKAFWDMKDEEQMKFFSCVYDEVTKNSQDTFLHYLELQSFHLENRIRESKDKKAQEVIMTLAAPFFLHTLNQPGVYF